MKKKDIKILKKINKEAWDKYGSKLLKEEDIAPNIKFVVEKALTEHRDKLTEDKIEQLEALQDMGYFDGKHVVEDEDVAKKFNEYTERRIKQEIEAGNLTPREEDEDYKKYKEKQEQYARRKKRDHRRTQEADLKADRGE